MGSTLDPVTLGTYFAFLTVAVILAITPGPDTLLSLRYALVSRRAGCFAATGSSSAAFIWAALAAFGLAALFEASDIAYDLVSLIGGAYLLWLGVRTGLSARTRFTHASVIVHARLQEVRPLSTTTDPTSAPAAVAVKGRTAFAAGMATCMTNPKVGLFFLALFPQFTPDGAHPLFAVGVLGGTVVAAMFAYLIGVVMVVDAANRWLSNPAVTGWIELISALMLAGLGLFMLGSGVLGLWP